MTLENSVWMLMLAVLTWVIGRLMMPKTPGRFTYLVLVMVSLAVKYVLVFIMYAQGTEVSGTDGLIYHQVAKDVASQLKAGVPLFSVEYEYTWYTVLAGIQYALFGVNRYAASFVNAFIGTLSGFMLTGIALELRYSFKKSAFVGIAYLLVPSLMVWTTDTRKESVTFFIVLLIWYLTLNLIRNKDRAIVKKAAVCLCICFLLWISTLLRIYMLYTLGGGILVCLFFLYLKTGRKTLIYFALAVLLTGMFATYYTVLANMKGYHAIPMDRSNGGDEDIAGELDAEIDSIIGVILKKNLPDAVNGFLLRPYPSQAGNISDIAGNEAAIILLRLEQHLWYVCLALAFFGALNAFMKWNPFLLGILAYIVTYSAINILISENVAETYFRYRAALIGPVLLLADPRPFINNLRGYLTGKSVLSADRSPFGG